MIRPIALLSAALLALLWAGALLTWPHLPDRIPTHFGFSGEPDRWEPTSPLAWFGLPLIATGIVLLNGVLGLWLPRRPDLVNLPDKKRFLALPPEYRRPVIGRLTEFLHRVNLQVLILFGSIQWIMYRAAQGAETRTLMLVLLILGIAVLPALLIWSTSGIQEEVTRQVHRHRADQDAGLAR